MLVSTDSYASDSNAAESISRMLQLNYISIALVFTVERPLILSGVMFLPQSTPISVAVSYGNRLKIGP